MYDVNSDFGDTTGTGVSRLSTTEPTVVASSNKSTEKAFIGAGKVAGLELWRIEKLKPVKQKKVLT